VPTPVRGWKRGLVLMEGWPRYKVRVVEGALEVKFSSTDPDSIEREAQ
jgi:DNA-directed RNA polymerase subunit N (RpoN/RPB10)